MGTCHKRAFTITELLVLMAITSFGVIVLTPALAKTKSNGKAIQCLNNLRQFTAAWLMYPGDNADHVPNNFGNGDTITAIQNGRLDNWANNSMTWGAGNTIY